MKKVLVPTDFSANSKSGIRFAINWSRRQPLELVFIHVIHLLRPTVWSDSVFDKHAKQEEDKYKEKLEKHIAGIYKSMNVKPAKHALVVTQGLSPDIAILDYCRRNKKIDYICISTRGAGKFQKIYGTNTSNLITKSEVPVLAIPKSYKIADVKNVLYATDLQDYQRELMKVVDFAQPLKATIDVLHITWPSEIILDKKNMEVALKKQYKYSLKIHFEKQDTVYSLIQNLQNQIRIRKPSVVIMFTNQQRSFLHKLFLSSKSEELSFQSKVPLLVFNKPQKK